MGAQVLMFAFAATIAIYLYSTITSRVDGVMLANNYSNRGDAIVADQDTDINRTATKAEVIMAILDLKSKYEKTGDSSYAVKVDSTTFTYDEHDYVIKAGTSIEITLDSHGRYKLMNLVTQNEYEFKYDQSGKTLIYE